MARLTIPLLSAAIIALAATEVASSDALDIHLSSPKGQYVIREPVRFTVTLTNVSDRTIRIPDVRQFDMNMNWVYLDLIAPDGASDARWFSYRFDVGALNQLYNGEPLIPGASFEFFLYPNATRSVEFDLDGANESRLRVTFDQAGEWRVRVVYAIPSFYTELWKPAAGDLYSNIVTMEFRRPTQIEQEILDAYWAMGAYWVSTGDDHSFFEFDETRLRSVIAAYPDSQMIQYARFALARVLVLPRIDGVDMVRIQEGIEIFEQLMKENPEFRREEMHQHLAEAYYAAGKREKAIELLDSVMAERPALKDHYHFMKKRVFIEQMTTKAISTWIYDRQLTTPRPGDRFEEN